MFYAVDDGNNNYQLQRNINQAGLKYYEFEPGTRIAESSYLTSFDYVSTNFQKGTIDNYRILAKDTAAFCFGAPANLLLIKPATVSSVNWQGNFKIEAATIVVDTCNFIIEEYPFTMNVVCNIVNKCDTLKFVL